MRSEIPYHVNIRLKKSKIDTNTVDIKDFPKLATFNYCFNLINCRCILKCMANHENLFFLS